MLTKNSKKLIARNTLIFFIVYLFMMSITTYFTTVTIESNMKDKANDAINDLSNTMSQTILTNADKSAPISATSIYNQMCSVTRSAARENIYIRAELYNGLNELMARTGNVLIIENYQTDENDAVINPENTSKYLYLNDYFSIEEINTFFKPKELWNTLNVRVTGIDNNDIIIPQKIELFDSSSMSGKSALNEKVFSNISGNEEVFGNNMFCEAYFERKNDIGMITKTDQNRYNNCTTIAQSSLQQYKSTGSVHRENIEDNIFVVQYGCVQTTDGCGKLNSRYLSIGIEYHPLEEAILKLLPVYILSFIFISIIAFILSLRIKRKDNTEDDSTTR